MADEFTHLTDSGVHMVEVGGKPDQKRRAIASGSIFLDRNTISLIQNEEIKKGNVLTTAQIAGIQAVKNTSSIIPLCHPLALTGIELDFEVKEDEIIAICAVNTLGKTGVELLGHPVLHALDLLKKGSRIFILGIWHRNLSFTNYRSKT